MSINYTDYINHFNIKDGEYVSIISDITPLVLYELSNGRKFDVRIFIESIKDRLQNNTVLIPTFNWGFCRGEVFDYNNTPSEAGILGTYALKDKDFKRTKHPIYSFAVYGKDRDMLCSLDYESSFGCNSVFSYLYKVNAAHLCISVHTYTVYHHIEECYYKDIIKYRYLKTFTSDYIDEKGEKSRKSYSMFVRNLELNTILASEPYKKYLVDNGIAKVSMLNGIPFYFSHTKDYCEVVKDDVVNNRSRKIIKYDGQED